MGRPTKTTFRRRAIGRSWKAHDREDQSGSSHITLFGERRGSGGFAITIGVEATARAAAHRFVRATGITRAAGVAIPGNTESFEELLDAPSRIVKESSELRAASVGVARVTNVVTGTAPIIGGTRIATIVGGARIATITDFVARTTSVIATALTESLEEVPQQEPGLGTATVVAVTGTASIVAGAATVIGVAGITTVVGSARITTLGGKKRS